jgi:ABC-type uncharacterized transport system fused permease/ATPase subunit
MTSELYSILQVLAVSITSFTYGLTLLGNSILAVVGLLCLILFSFIMLGIVQFFSKLTSSRVSDLKQDEGLFSFQHTRIKKNCESIAFYSGQSLELAKIKLKFDAVLQSARKVIKAQMILDFLGNFLPKVAIFFTSDMLQNPIVQLYASFFFTSSLVDMFSYKIYPKIDIKIIRRDIAFIFCS